jgi:hypothetical protein
MSTKSNSIVLVIGIITLLYVATVSNSSVAATDPYTSLYPSGQNENSTINTESSFNNLTNPTNPNIPDNLNFTTQENTLNNTLLPIASSTINDNSSATSSNTTTPEKRPQLPCNTSLTTVQPNNSTNDELKKKIRASIPTYLILVDLNMTNKNTTDYGVIDLTVTLNGIAKVKSINTTTFSGDDVVLPFRFNANADKTPIQVNNEFNLCASGEFLASSVCNTGTIQTINPPLTKTSIVLG